MSKLPYGLRERIWLRDNGTCRRCGRAGTDVHHRIPRGMGGTRWEHQHNPSLLVLLCRDCHTWIETHRTEAYNQNWLLHRTEWEQEIEAGNDLPTPTPLPPRQA